VFIQDKIQQHKR